MANLPSNFPPTMVVIAFRANIYSYPLYVASANTTLSTGYGFVQTLSMMLSFCEWAGWLDLPHSVGPGGTVE
jgi:hypothetical protein